MRDGKVGVQGGAVGCHDAMGGPEYLLAVGKRCGLERLAAGVVGGEGDVVGRVPVLRDDHGGEFGREAVDEGDDGVAIRYREGAAGAKIVLDVYNQEGGIVLHGRDISNLPQDI